MKYLLKLTLAILTATSAQASAQADCGEHEIESSEGACVACDNSMTPNSDHSECVCPQPIPYWDGSKCDFCPRSMKWDGTACVASGCPVETPVWIKSLKSIINPASLNQPTPNLICGGGGGGYYKFITGECAALTGGCTLDNCRDLSISEVVSGTTNRAGFIYGDQCALTSKVLSAPCLFNSGATAPYGDYGYTRYNFEIDVDQGECAACPVGLEWDGTECKDCNGVIEGSSTVGDCGECVGQIGADIDGEAPNDYSGSSVSLSADGNIMAIGATGNAGTDVLAGHVRVYQRDKSVPLGWKQLGEDIDGEGRLDQSGGSVSLSANGNIVAIGATGNEEDSNYNAGHVRVYEWDASEPPSWKQVGQDIDGEAGGDHSGVSVSLSAGGSVLAIGAKWNDNEGGDGAGHVRVYQRDENAPLGWKQLGGDIDGETQSVTLGYSVSLSSNGSVIAIGAPGRHSVSNGDSHVRIYRRDEGVALGWIQLGVNINNEATWDNSGSSVSLSADGTIVAIGATSNDDGGNYAGHVRVFNGTPTSYSLKTEGRCNFYITDLAECEEAAEALNLVQTTASARADRENDVESPAYCTFVNDAYLLFIDPPGAAECTSSFACICKSGGWTQLGGDIDGEAAEDASGFSVSLSADGTIVAIGAPYNDGGGDNAGHVRVYQRDENVPLGWKQVGQDFDGKAESDRSGYSVSLSADGSTVAIGAQYNNGGGDNAGHVRVYSLPNNVCTSCTGVSKWDSDAEICSDAYIKTNLQQLIDMRCSGDTDAAAAAAAFAELQQPCA